ncbi:MAG: YdjY domain-containing protein [Planctomycetota bacterium]|nr:YdjY domain-containing protein [Planctomycetota bacterium]
MINGAGWIAAVLLSLGAAGPSDGPASPAAKENVEGGGAVFPHVRIDAAARTVEFDGTVPIRLDDPRAPRVYLEVLTCIPDTKEHETLIVTSAKPSHVHAALLAIGVEPGKPATWRQEGTKMVPVAPEGAELAIELEYVDRDGAKRVDRPSQWIVNARTNEPWPEGPWVFAGSLMMQRQGREVYEADGSGTLIGLTSFGTEVIAWPLVISPDSQVQEPEWIADARRVPPMNTKVTVRLRAVGR